MEDLSTDYFIMALKRFIARRGRPHRKNSYNGTNFVGVNNELLEFLRQLNEEKVQTFVHQRRLSRISNHQVHPTSVARGRG